MTGRSRYRSWVSRRRTPIWCASCATSLAAVAHILRTRGEPGLLRVIAALSDRLPSEEALPVALAVTYAELQKALEDDLRTADARPARASSDP